MNATEATANIIIAMINNKLVVKTEDIAEAYNTIYNAIRNPKTIENV